MRILGIDPGYAIIGWGVVEYVRGRFSPVAFGAITTPAGMEFTHRLHMIHEDMEQIMERYAPDVLSVEKLYFTNNKTTGIEVAEARGVVLLSAGARRIPVYEYTPMQVKSAVAGYGKAAKPQVMEMTRRRLGLAEVPRPDDTADALALALCHGQMGGTALQRQIHGG